jgi:hypothetical protein
LINSSLDTPEAAYSDRDGYSDIDSSSEGSDRNRVGGGEASERNGDGGRDGRVGRVCENTSEGQGSQGLLELSVIDIQRRVTVGNNASDQKQL